MMVFLAEVGVKVSREVLRCKRSGREGENCGSEGPALQKREQPPPRRDGAGSKAAARLKKEDGGLKAPLRGGAMGIGVEAFFVEEEDAGTEGEEHDGDTRGDAEAGSHGCGAIVTAADDNVARDYDQQFQDAAFEQPRDEPGYHG